MGSDAAAVKPVILNFLRISIDHWWVILLALFFVSYFSVLFSHRIVGPMRRFENALLKKRENPDREVRCNLRTGDYFHDFSHLLEEVLNQGVEPSPGKEQAASEGHVAEQDGAPETTAGVSQTS